MTHALLPCEPFSDGEVAFFRRFIRRPSANRNGMFDCAIERWGFCPRHTLGLLGVCASIPRAGLHTASALYERVIRNAIVALRRCASPGGGYGQPLRSNEPCPMCELGLNEKSAGLIRREWLRSPNSLERLQALLNDTVGRWSSVVCARCVHLASGPLCRAHAAEALFAGGDVFDVAELDKLITTLEALEQRLATYMNTFLPESAGVDAGEGVAALIAAAGWCAGWELLSLAVGYRLVGGTANRC